MISGQGCDGWGSSDEWISSSLCLKRKSGSKYKVSTMQGDSGNGEQPFSNHVRSPRPASQVFRARGGVVLHAITAFLFALCSFTARSQSCGLTSIADTGKLEYPPIARAAHIQGPVVLLVTFRINGTVAKVKIVTAPAFLGQLMGKVAAEYVNSWRANAYSGPRECPIVVEFMMRPETSTPRETMYSRVDLQHVRIIAPVPIVIPQYAAAAHPYQGDWQH